VIKNLLFKASDIGKNKLSNIAVSIQNFDEDEKVLESYDLRGCEQKHYILNKSWCL
jgi:hypothetical protein